MHIARQCGNCDQNDRTCRHRLFNPQIWSLLVAWQEIPKESVGNPICDSCYTDIRELLIERSDEMEQALNAGTIATTPKKKQKTAAKKAARGGGRKKTPRKKTSRVAKAS